MVPIGPTESSAPTSALPILFRCRGGQLCPPGKRHIRNAKPFGKFDGSQRADVGIGPYNKIRETYKKVQPGIGLYLLLLLDGYQLTMLSNRLRIASAVHSVKRFCAASAGV